MGGTGDDQGNVAFVFHVPLEAQLAHYRANPPEAVKGLTPALTDVGDFSLNGHGEPVNTIFDLSCSCGGAAFHVMGQDGEWVRDPISLRCAACGKETEIFDTRKNGYDGAMGHNEGHPAPSAERAEMVANEIGDSPYRISVRYEYPSDVMGDASFSEWAGQESELYSWFTLLARPAAGGALEALFDHECS